MKTIALLFRALSPTILLAWTFPVQATKPNIVFAFADDWGRHAGAYARLQPGGPSDLLRTPGFDRVAREGVLFRHAFVNAPSCTPCRSSLLSGRYFWRTGRGAILQGAVWDPSIPTFPLLLEQNGYHIGYTYKVWSPGRPVNAPIGGARTAYQKHGTNFRRFSQAVSAAKNPEAAKETLLQEVRHNFLSFLRDRTSDQPFCYWWGPTNCHRKWIRGSGKSLWHIDPDQLSGKLPAFLPNVHEVREDLADYLGEIQAFDAGLEILLNELEHQNLIENTIVVVSGDHGAPGFPNGKCSLYDFGTHVSLAIRWPASIPDNRVLDDFVSLPDLAPTLLEAAGISAPSAMTARSLLPILVSDQSGLVDKTRDAVIVGRERHVAKARTGNLPYPQRALRTKSFLYIRNFKPERWPMGTAPGFGAASGPLPGFDALENNTFSAFADLDASPTKAWIATYCLEGERRKFFDFAFGQRPAEELYDLRKDPDQVRNVASEEAYTEVRQRLRDRLLRSLKASGDPRVTGDGSAFDKPPFVDAG